MPPESSDRTRLITFVVVTLLELPVLIALAGAIAPESSLLTTVVLLGVAVLLNWVVLEQSGRSG